MLHVLESENQIKTLVIMLQMYALTFLYFPFNQTQPQQCRVQLVADKNSASGQYVCVHYNQSTNLFSYLFI